MKHFKEFKSINEASTGETMSYTCNLVLDMDVVAKIKVEDDDENIDIALSDMEPIVKWKFDKKVIKSVKTEREVDMGEEIQYDATSQKFTARTDIILNMELITVTPQPDDSDEDAQDDWTEELDTAVNNMVPSVTYKFDKSVIKSIKVTPETPEIERSDF